jgi:hypothetical protein
MTNYSENPGHVRIDFWKPESGNWYMTEMLDMSDEYDATHVYAAVRNALAKTRHGRLADKRWIITVAEPYHVNAHPVMLSPGRASYEDWPTPSEGSRIFMGEVPADGLWNLPDWAAMYHIRVFDPDGWRNEGIDPHTPISQDDFFRLVSVSTVGGEGSEQFTVEMRAWAARK